MTESVNLEAECKRLHERSLRALEEELRTDKEHQVIQKEIKQLRRHGKALLQCSNDKKSAATKILEDYAKAACRKLCEDVYGAFPREIRDMIYGHLHARDEMRVTRGVKDRWSDGSEPYFNSCSEKHWCASGAHEVAGTKDLWWDSCCVGENMLRELSEHYYRTVLFLFAADCELLPKFRITDQWGLGFVPGDIATNIGISIDRASYAFADIELILRDDSSSANANISWSAWDIDSTPDRKPCEALSLDLEHLFGFRAGTNIFIQVSVETIKKRSLLENQQWMCDAVMPILLSTLQRLKVAGYKLKIVLSSKERWAFSRDTEDDFTFSGQKLDMDVMQSSFGLFKVRALGKIQLKKDAEEGNDSLGDIGDDNEDNEEGHSSNEGDDD
ncbi:hypothetical protein HBI76_171810 [Parastagonospora nodorum]|nr:hypothetical protein HBI76_171810 [Parastagonospora nodorum]